MFNRMLAVLMLLGMSAAAAGCNTIHGMGQDIERGGAKTQEAADSVKRKM